jgi:hypothetical protein
MATATERKQQLRAARLAEGRCPDCGGKPSRGKTRCGGCLEKQRAYNAERRERLARQKRCVCCGQEKSERGSRYGRECQNRFAAYQRQYAGRQAREAR